MVEFGSGVRQHTFSNRGGGGGRGCLMVAFLTRPTVAFFHRSTLWTGESEMNKRQVIECLLPSRYWVAAVTLMRVARVILLTGGYSFNLEGGNS